MLSRSFIFNFDCDSIDLKLKCNYTTFKPITEDGTGEQHKINSKLPLAVSGELKTLSTAQHSDALITSRNFSAAIAITINILFILNLLR